MVTVQVAGGGGGGRGTAEAGAGTNASSTRIPTRVVSAFLNMSNLRMSPIAASESAAQDQIGSRQEYALNRQER